MATELVIEIQVVTSKRLKTEPVALRDWSSSSNAYYYSKRRTHLWNSTLKDTGRLRTCSRKVVDVGKCHENQCQEISWPPPSSSGITSSRQTKPVALRDWSSSSNAYYYSKWWTHLWNSRYSGNHQVVGLVAGKSSSENKSTLENPSGHDIDVKKSWGVVIVIVGNPSGRTRRQTPDARCQTSDAETKRNRSHTSTDPNPVMHITIDKREYHFWNSSKSWGGSDWKPMESGGKSWNCCGISSKSGCGLRAHRFIVCGNNPKVRKSEKLLL